jgi:hypothetical protein
VVSNYLLLLYDFGQVAPTYSNISLILNTGDPLQTFTSANNIFISTTLFAIFDAYLRDVPLQMIDYYLSDSNFTFPPFLDLDTNNTPHPFDTPFLRDYSCVERRLKGLISVAISILVADYAFIVSGYKVIVLLIGTWLKHIDKDDRIML